MSRKYTFMTAAQVRQNLDSATSELEKLGLGNEIRQLSQAIGALRDAGLDVEFEASGWPGSSSFLGADECNSDINGILRIGNNRHILSLLTRDDDSRKYWALSFYNAVLGPVEDRKDTFDLSERNCYEQLQQRIINLAVENRFIEENDIAGAFTLGARSRVQLMKPHNTKSLQLQK